ncbi:MAG: FUN14 domain-containing protein [Nitrososphaeraceae archaeon]|nr:FUN14 domain-containing protein [Nitrososphaeraceae archaeon]MDW0166635.1 FUN14 domain-containing protein [Nitrososphaeraceae archaeon]
MFIDFSSLATSIGIGGLATSIGIGGFLGFLMGYAIKKIIKIIIVVAGLLVGIMYYLQYNGLVALNWAKVEATLGNAMTNFNGFSLNTPFFPGISDQILDAISNSGIPLTGGFAAGFAFGLSKG